MLHQADAAWYQLSCMMYSEMEYHGFFSAQVQSHRVATYLSLGQDVNLQHWSILIWLLMQHWRFNLRSAGGGGQVCGTASCNLHDVLQYSKTVSAEMNILACRPCKTFGDTCGVALHCIALPISHRTVMT